MAPSLHSPSNLRVAAQQVTEEKGVRASHSPARHKKCLGKIPAGISLHIFSKTGGKY